VTEVEQFYESTDNVQGNNSKGVSLVKEKGREKHPTGTKKPLQDASHTEAAAAKRMQELMRQFSTILRQASTKNLQHFCSNLYEFSFSQAPYIWISFYS